jgi:PAS domain S-box-containing protein
LVKNIDNKDDNLAAARLHMIEAGLDNINQAMTIFDQDLKLVYANSKTHDLLGLPYELMVPGTTLEEIFRYNAMSGEYGIGNVEDLVKERMDAARRFEVHTVERQRPNGIYLRVSGKPLSIGGFATIYTDITEQRQREIRQEILIAERTRDLRRSEERLRLISNEVPAGIAYLNQNLVFEFTNIRFARGYSRAPEEMIGKTAKELLSPETYKKAVSYFKQAVAGRQSDFGMQIKLMDGRERYIQTYLHPDFGRDGNARGFYLLSINMTRQRQAEKALSQAQKMEAVGRLSSGIAHDFNNLLTIIMGNLRSLSDNVEDPAVKTSMIEPALRATKRGASLTEQLLSFARGQPLTPKIIDINEAVQSVTRLVRSSLSENIELSYREPEEKIFAFLDRSQFESSLLNLVLNAQQAIAGEGQIDISVVETSDNVRICVTDTGVGMTESLIHKIFDPFFTTKENEGGTGLGLSMTQSFVEQSKGQIKIKSAPGAGTEVTILLPSVEGGIEEEPDIEAEELDVSGLQVALLVDDEDEVRKVLRRDLLKLGYGVLESDNAEDALRLLGSVEDISLVVSDIAMPGDLSGYDLAKSVHKLYRHIAVVLITGHADVNKPEIANCGNAQVLRKPFDMASLVSSIKKASNHTLVDNEAS